MPGAAEASLADDLLLLAVTDPSAAEVAARELADSTRDGWLRSVARLSWRLSSR